MSPANTGIKLILIPLLGIALARVTEPIWAGYKARSWSIGARNSYPATLTSEGVTIAVEPLFTDALAARVFDKNDIISRGIMPLAILVFNDNDFPVDVDGPSIELIHEGDHIQTLMPDEVVYRLFKKEKSWIPRPIPKLSRSELNRDALADFEKKFLRDKAVAPHNTGGGFLYMPLREYEDLRLFLSDAILYVPRIYRGDNGTRLIFFEIELKPAVNLPPLADF